MDLLHKIFDYVVSYKDPRIKDWILFTSPYPMILILFSYLYFVLVCGPRYMKNRDPYSLKTFIKYYNIFQIFMNSFIVHKLIKGGWFTTISIYCEPTKYGTDPASMELLEACWWTLLTKFIDLLETGIFILRKKDRQISFLHLYHHISTLLVGWLFGKYCSYGAGTLLPLVNCSVHVIMYTYYFLSTCGPNVRKVIHRYKYLLTIVQMVQFVVLICIISQVFILDCDSFVIPGYIMIINLLINFVLFYNFYKKTYIVKQTKQS